MLPQNNLR